MSLFSPEGIADPFPVYRRLRELDPVHYSETTRSWVLTRYEDCRQVLTDPANFRSLDAEWLDANMPGWRGSRARVLIHSMLPFHNAPDHTRLRRLLARSFTVTRVRELGPKIESAVDSLLDRLESAASGGAVVNFQEVVSRPLTTTVIGDLLGMPAEDLRTFDMLGVVLSKTQRPNPTDEELADADKAAAETEKYFRGLFAQRRAEPRDDLISMMVGVHDDDNDRLSEVEMFSAVVTLYLAGFETTTGVIASGLNALLQDREQFALLRENPSLVDSAVEEMLRCFPSIAFQPRHSAAGVAVGGVTIPAGARVLVGFSPASRDPAQFEEPDRFDITREPGRTLSFSSGIHSCMGAALARLEITTLLRALIARFPALECAGPPVYRPSATHRGVLDLPVRA